MKMTKHPYEERGCINSSQLGLALSTLDLFIKFNELGIFIGIMQTATAGSNYGFLPRFMKYRGTKTRKSP